MFKEMTESVTETDHLFEKSFFLLHRAGKGFSGQLKKIWIHPFINCPFYSYMNGEHLFRLIRSLVYPEGLGESQV